MSNLTQGITNYLLQIPHMLAKTDTEKRENNRKVEDWANQTPFLTLYGVSSNLAGAPWTAQTPTQTFLVQCGNNQPTFDAFGRATITYPFPFPNSVLAISAISGTGQVYYNVTNVLVTSFDLIATNTPLGAPNALASGVIGVTWIAIGW